MPPNSHTPLRRLRVAVLGAAATLLATAMGMPVDPSSPSAAAQALFASPTGHGSACSQSNPCTLTAARDEVRKLHRSMTHDIVVQLRGGTYHIDSTFMLGPQDSGMNGHKVVWQAYPGEKPVLSGGTKVTGWKQFDSEKNIYRAQVPTGTKSRQMYVDGKRAYRVRSKVSPAGFPDHPMPNPIVSSDTRYLSWRDPGPSNPLELIGEQGWKHTRCPVTSIKAPSSGSGSAFTLATPCYSQGGAAPADHARPPYNAGTDPWKVKWIENAYELLGEPGHFYLDTAAGYLYYVPRAGEDLSKADVQLPTTETLMSLTGTPGPPTPVNDSHTDSISYAPADAWHVSADRPHGDFDNDVHYTEANGSSATITFTGAGINVLGEKYSDLGDIDVHVDGKLDKTVSAHTSGERRPMQVLYSRKGLKQGKHTVKLVKKSGTFLLLDGYVPLNGPFEPVHDITVSGISFAYTTWLAPNDSSGYWENQAGLLWTDTAEVFRRPAAALKVARGKRIEVTGGEFSRLGGTGIDLGSGTQDSKVSRTTVQDTSGTGISVGEFTDFWLTDTDLMTSGDAIENNKVSYAGQEYPDTVGILAGYTRNVTLAHNDVAHLPYTGISMNIGWMYFDPCPMVDQANKGANAPWAQPCRNGSNYARSNRITGNRVQDVMNYLHDGAGIYVNGGQGTATAHSTISRNVVYDSPGNGLYVDIGSSNWEVTDNVTTHIGRNWADMWAEAIYDVSYDKNYSDTRSCDNNGYIRDYNPHLDYSAFKTCRGPVPAGGGTPTTTVTNTTYLTDGNWPAAAKEITETAGVK